MQIIVYYSTYDRLVHHQNNSYYLFVYLFLLPNDLIISKVNYPRYIIISRHYGEHLKTSDKSLKYFIYRFSEM